MNIDDAGFEVLRAFIGPDDIRGLLSALGPVRLEPLHGGMRHIDRVVPSVGALAKSDRLFATARAYLQGKASLVRAIYFDKSPGNNWLVSWHQDKTIAVSTRVDVPGWGPWTQKDGVWHVQPPVEILRDMIAIRIHLDDAERENGCLKLIPGSQRHGLLSAADIHARTAAEPAVYCEVEAGDALVMRPHVLHASEKACKNAPRRILHLEYSSAALPDGLAWAT